MAKKQPSANERFDSFMTGKPGPATNDPKAEQLVKYFSTIVHQNNKNALSLEVTAMKNYSKNVNDQGEPIDNKDQIKTGREIYQGWHNITEKIFGTANTPELGALRERAIRQAIGGPREKAGLEAMFKTGTPVSPSQLLSAVLPIKGNFKAYMDDLHEDIYLTPDLAESDEAKDTLVTFAQGVGLDLKKDQLKTSQDFIAYAKITARTLSKRAGYE